MVMRSDTIGVDCYLYIYSDVSVHVEARTVSTGWYYVFTVNAE